MFVGGLELSLRLHIGHSRFLDEPGGERPFLQQFFPAVQNFFRTVAGLASGLDIGLRFHHRFGNSCAFGSTEVGFGLIDGTFAFRRSGHQIAILEDRQELA